MSTKPLSSSSSLIVYPKIVNHITVSVQDLDHAIKWYKEVFGFTLVRGPVELLADDSLARRAVRDIHGPDLKKMRMAWLSSGNQIGFEIFEYVEPKAQRHQDNFEYWKSGFTHICITDPIILKIYVIGFLKMEESSVVKFGKLFQRKDTR